jgi:hypothetical protein
MGVEIRRSGFAILMADLVLTTRQSEALPYCAKTTAAQQIQNPAIKYGTEVRDRVGSLGINPRYVKS